MSFAFKCLFDTWTVLMPHRSYHTHCHQKNAKKHLYEKKVKIIRKMMTKTYDELCPLNDYENHDKSSSSSSLSVRFCTERIPFWSNFQFSKGARETSE